MTKIFRQPAFPTAILLWMLMAGTLHSQIDVDLSIGNDRYVAGEPIRAIMDISNKSGQTITVGNIPGWADISVEQKSGGVALKTGSLSTTEGISIASGKRYKIPVDLTQLYLLHQPARYSVKLNLNVVGWNQPFTAKEIIFDVVKGNLVWSQNFSTPTIRDSDGSLPTLTWNLITNSSKTGNHLLVQVDQKEEGKILRTIPVCKLLSFSSPEARVDPISNLHILCQYGQNTFTYNVYNPIGELLVRLTYQAAPAKPTLEYNQDGLVEVKGGIRVAMDTDYLPDLASK